MHYPYLPNQHAIDHPMVLLANRDRVDRGDRHGVWLDLSHDIDQLTEQCRHAGLKPRSMIVIDQVGLGPIMLDEDLGLIELVARYHWPQP